MNYADVQKSIEKYLQAQWTATALKFENQAFNTDMYEEYTRATIQFGDSVLRSLGVRCYRTPGILFLDFYVRPGVGSHRLVELADLASDLLVGTSVAAVLPDTAPVVEFTEPSLSKDLAERTGWVSAQLMIEFYFDITEA
jgi:hypothetical protein